MHKGIMYVVLMVVGFALLSGCASMKSASPEEFEMSVREAWDKFSTAMVTEDMDLFASIHADDVIKVTPGRPPVVGFTQEQKVKSMAFQNGEFESFDVELDEIEVSGDMGFCRGSVAYVFIPDSGQGQMQMKGNFITIFKRQADGSWKIYRGCNTPAP